MTLYGPPTAQEHLRQSVRYSTDPKWRAQHSPDAPPPRPIPWGILILAIIGIGLSLALFGYANASERERPHDLWLLVKPVEDRRNIFKIGVGYQSKAACESVKRGMVRVVGTLQCHPLQGE